MTPPRFDVLSLFPIPLYVGLVDEAIIQVARDATRTLAYEPNAGNANTVNHDVLDEPVFAPLRAVVLAQEVYRTDSAIPVDPGRHAARRPAARAGHRREEIVDTAHALGMNLRYSPSMRNGSCSARTRDFPLPLLPRSSRRPSSK